MGTSGGLAKMAQSGEQRTVRKAALVVGEATVFYSSRAVLDKECCPYDCCEAVELRLRPHSSQTRCSIPESRFRSVLLEPRQHGGLRSLPISNWMRPCSSPHHVTGNIPGL